MPHSFNRIWIHAIWSTKKREELIDRKIEKQIYKFMTSQFFELGCPVRIINGMQDHVHCLFLLNPAKSVSDVIKHIKGATSFFINEKNMLPDQWFEWQTGYAAFSVSESVVEKVVKYIKQQKVHHAKVTFEKEQESFLRLHGFTNTPNYKSDE